MKMVNKVTIKEVLTGYENIRTIIDKLILENNVEFIASEIAPNTFEGMKNYNKDFNKFLVFSGGDHGLLGAEYNIKFRALHDFMHIENNLSFSFEDEIKLSGITSGKFFNIAWSQLGLTVFEATLIYNIIEAEIKGQIEFYRDNKKYVKDQSKFVLDYLKAV